MIRRETLCSVDLAGRWDFIPEGGPTDRTSLGGVVRVDRQGIFRSAHLRVYPVVFIEDVWVETSVLTKKATVHGTVFNAGRENQQLRAHLRLYGGRWSYPQVEPLELQLAPGERREITFADVPWTLGPESWWWPNA